MDKQKEIEFNNGQNPKSGFDLVKIEDVLKMSSEHHSSFEYHILKFYAILVVTAGNGNHFIDFNKYQCSKGAVLLIGDGQTHKFSKNTDLKGYILLFRNDFLGNILNINETIKVFQIFNNSLFEPKIQINENQFPHITRRVENIKNEYLKIKDDYSSKILGGEMYTLISILFRESIAINNTSLDAKYLTTFLVFQDLITNNIFNTTKVIDYANLLGLSTKTLNTITKSIMGKPAKMHINEYYLLCVKRLLIDKKKSIKECAYESGFDDIPNFYKFIRKHLNQTPEQFRENF